MRLEAYVFLGKIPYVFFGSKKAYVFLSGHPVFSNSLEINHHDTVEKCAFFAREVIDHKENKKRFRTKVNRKGKT